MDLHRLGLFVHVAAILGLFAALAIEWVALRSLARATSYEQSREWTRVLRMLPAIGAPSLVAALLSGIYLATSLGAWRLSWVAVAIPTLVIVAVAGGLTAPARNRMRQMLIGSVGALPNAVQAQLSQTFWRRSLRLRTALLSGLVFEMTVRPEAGVWVIGGVAVLGLAWGAVLRS